MKRLGIIDRLQAGEVLIMDGATGSELQQRGVDVNKGSVEGRLGVWSAAANLDAPDVVRAIHEDYLKAGAEIITSNNFYTSRTMMNVIGKQDQWEEYTRRAGELACQARDAINPEAYVAGGIAPPEDKCNLYEQFVEQARVLAAAGVDFMLAEYMAGDSVMEDPLSDCVTAVDACAQSGLPVILGVCRVSERGTMYDGTSFDALVSALEGHPVDAICLMCSYPQDIDTPRLRRESEVRHFPRRALFHAWAGRVHPRTLRRGCSWLEGDRCPNHRRLLRYDTRPYSSGASLRQALAGRRGQGADCQGHFGAPLKPAIRAEKKRNI
jgi:methionine synthase I (cobalamin-dependent)